MARDIVVSATSSDTFIFFAESIFIGIHAADEHVAKAVNVEGKIFFHQTLTAFVPPDIKAYSVYITI